MSTAVAPPRDVVRRVTREEANRRLKAAESEMKRYFGSVPDALRQEFTGDYPSEQVRIFSEYHGMRFLLGK